VGVGVWGGWGGKESSAAICFSTTPEITIMFEGFPPSKNA
jgi:hypothetical protein